MYRNALTQSLASLRLGDPFSTTSRATVLLPKVAARRRHVDELHPFETIRHDVHDVPVTLDLAVCGEQRARRRDVTPALEGASPEDQIDEPRFVLHRDEHDAARRLRPLPADDEP